MYAVRSSVFFGASIIRDAPPMIPEGLDDTPEKYFSAAYNVFMGEMQWLKETRRTITTQEAEQMHHFLDTVFVAKNILEAGHGLTRGADGSEI